MRLAVAIAAALVLAAAPAWAAGGATLAVRPASVSRGSTVTFTGAGCLRGDSVFLISTLFPGHAFGGAGSIRTTARAGGHFSRAFVVGRTTARGRYVITARCGGGNLGVEAHLRVR